MAGLCILAVAGLLALVLARRLSRRIMEPLNKLHLDNPLENEGYDELAPLLRRIHNQQQQRREFTANVSHELKTPLHVLSGYSELLKCGIARQEDVQSFAGKIYNETQRLIALVDDIINLSHLDEGGKGLNWSDVDLYASAGQAVQSLGDIARENGITLTLEGGRSVVCGIPELVRTMIHNLCDNAIKYNRSGGSVVIRAENGMIRVEDTGIGIRQEDLGRIFERFYRVNKSRSGEVGGTGLGLSIVKHAAQIHDAKIDVRSVVGEGTTITITFPKKA